jgi:hypothetical protein
MRRTGLISLLVALTSPTAELRAQWQLTGDVGLSYLQQPGIPTGSGLSLGGTFDAATAHTLFRASALTAGAGANRWTGQGLMVGSLVGPAARLSWDLTAIASTFREATEETLSSGEAIARVRIGTASTGGAIGGGAGTTRGQAWNPLYQAQASAWWSVAAERFGADFSAIHARTTFRGGVAPALELAPSPVSYLDVGPTWRHQRGGFDIGASAGVRLEMDGSRHTNGWGTADATTWMTPNAALVVSAGRTLPDIVRGVPTTTFVTVALRLAVQPHASLFERGARTRGPQVLLAGREDDSQRLEVRGVSASTVDLMADFTDWSPVPLERVGDSWRLARSIPSGLHRLAVRLDGGPWLAPSNLPHASDDLGGVVGLITVP